MSIPATLLSTLQQFNVHDIADGPTHPFSNGSRNTRDALQNIVQGTSQLSRSLGQYMNIPITKPALLTELREHASSLHSVHSFNHAMQQMIDTLNQQPSIGYGEDIPLEPTALVQWCISRFEAWGVEAGMETFKDEENQGVVSLIFGGKVLVIDVEFALKSTTPALSITSVKTSYAIPDGESPNTNGSASLDGFLGESMRAFCDEVQKPDGHRDPLKAAQLGSAVVEHLKYLVVLDRLAERPEDGGIRWFVDVDKLCATLEDFASKEAGSVAKALSNQSAPLDILLLRAHAVPLPYLNIPSITFLVHLSPLTYLSLLKGTSSSTSGIATAIQNIDIPLLALRRHLSSQHLNGVTMATLRIVLPSPRLSPLPDMTVEPTRPNFPLIPAAPDMEHVFPQIKGDTTSHCWILDFTDNGRHRGVVMSQARMRDIELIINPLSSLDDMGSPIPFGIGSWVDLLFTSKSSGAISPERYEALYVSPNSTHPSLQLRLTAPEEPGYILDKVPIQSMKDVWGILEIVREQAWLNQILLSCKWTPEGLERPIAEDADAEQNMDAIDADLNAILAGSLPPLKIPVNIFLPSPLMSIAPSDVLYNAANTSVINTGESLRPKLVLSSPERPPLPGLVEITVSYDENKPKGVRVQVSGGVGSDLATDTMEEIVRRGGLFGLPGRIWARCANR